MAEVRLPKRIMNSGGWCQGCGHGVVVRLIAEVLDELGVADKAIAVEDVACGSMSMSGVLNCDAIMAAHGRPIPVANGAKGARPDSIVYAHLGDGSAYSIGSAELVHTALRGDNMTVIVVNNTVYGMTGGQMAPTSLPGQVTQTSPYGRDTKHCGFPIKVCEMLSELEGPEYLERVTVSNVKNIVKAKKAIKKAFQNQIDGKGFSLVEVVSTCPTNWGMTPQNALKWLEENMLPYYPLGVYKDRSAKEETK